MHFCRSPDTLPHREVFLISTDFTGYSDKATKPLYECRLSIFFSPFSLDIRKMHEIVKNQNNKAEIADIY